MVLAVKLGVNLRDLSEKVGASLNNKVSDLMFPIDEISMVSSDLWTKLDVRLSDIFSKKKELSCHLLDFQW